VNGVLVRSSSSDPHAPYLSPKDTYAESMMPSSRCTCCHRSDSDGERVAVRSEDAGKRISRSHRLIGVG
jgi:hypothetical protein